MCICEWWSWDLVTFLAGLCDTATGARADPTKQVLAAQGLLTNVICITYCLAFAINRGTSTVVGNALGANDPAKARLTAHVGLALAVVAMVVGCAQAEDPGNDVQP